MDEEDNAIPALLAGKNLITSATIGRSSADGRGVAVGSLSARLYARARAGTTACGVSP